MTEEKIIKLKYQNKEVSSPMPSSLEECKSFFKNYFSIDDEKLEKLSLFYTDKDGDPISLEKKEDYLNFSQNNEKVIEGEILEDKENEEEIPAEGETKEKEENLEENVKKSEIKSKINEEIKEPNLGNISLECPTTSSILFEKEIKGEEETNIANNLKKLEEIISNDNKEKSEIKNNNDKKIEEKVDNSDIQKDNKIEEDKKVNEINDKMPSEINDKKGEETENKIIKEKENLENENNNKNKNNIIKENVKNNEENINDIVKNKNNNDENKGNEKDKKENSHENIIDNNHANSNNNNINNKSMINNNNNNNRRCRINWFLIISIFANLIAVIMYFVFKKKLEDNEKKVIIGIDFGSTASGYSIIYDSLINFDDSDSKEVISSELIMDSETEIGLRIGNKAHYFPKNRIKPENKLYFCKFKKNLDPKNNKNYVESNVPKGVKKELKNIIKGFLSLLREEIEINNKRIKTTNINDIKWIITVPPLWDEKGKKFMKDVAYESGMIHSEIALEPEAASLSIFHDKDINKKYLVKGKNFLIVDAGGYTVDISANKIIDDSHNLEQLLKPNSEILGSNLINERIIEIIETIYGKSTIEDVIKNNYEAWEKTLDEIEEKKKEIDDNTAENFRIDIKFNKKKCSMFSDECEGQYNGTKIQYSSTHIEIPSQIIINIISEIATNVVNIINKSFSKTNENIDLIVLTGGFSNCKIFEKKIRNNFIGSLKQLVFLKSPQETVMKGAAIFGLFPNQILYRISPVIVAVNNYEYAKENDECESLEKDENGNTLCLKYKIFIERGKSVKTNEIIEKIIKPINETVNIYYSFNDEINEKDINLLDTLDIPPSDLPIKNRTLTISMRFSNYINITVMDKESDKGIWKIVYYPS